MTETIRSDAAAMLAARRELGSEFDEHFVDAFADRIVAEVERRLRHDEPRERASARGNERVAVYAMTLVFGIPLTAIAAGTEHLPGLIVAWSGIVGANVAGALGARRRTDRNRR